MRKVNQINQVEFYVSTIDAVEFPPHIGSWAVILGQTSDISKLGKILSKVKVILSGSKNIEDIAKLTAKKDILLLEAVNTDDAFFSAKNILKLVDGVVYLSDAPFNDSEKEINQFANLSV